MVVTPICPCCGKPRIEHAIIPAYSPGIISASPTKPSFREFVSEMMVDISSSGLFSYPSASYIVSAPKRNVHSDKELLIMISKGRYVTPDEKKRALLYSQKLRIKKLKK